MATPLVTTRSQGRSVDYTPVAAVAAGAVVVQSTLVGIAPQAIAAGALGRLDVEGIFRFPKSDESGSAIAAGDKCYWDATNSLATETVGANQLIGKAVLAAADATAYVDIKLNQ